jgi:hypothetical protein
MNLYRNFTTQEQIDLEYNFSLTVPDVKDWGDFFVKQSTAARSNLDCSLDVRYGLRSQPVDATHAFNLAAGV